VDERGQILALTNPLFGALHASPSDTETFAPVVAGLAGQ
jgi:hypothetical protein